MSKDTPLGVALMELTSLPADGSAVERWLGLEPATGMDMGMACGRHALLTAVGCWCAVWFGVVFGVFECMLWYCCKCLFSVYTRYNT